MENVQHGLVAPWKKTLLPAALPPRPRMATQLRLRIMLIDGSEGKVVPMQSLCRVEPCAFMFILCVIWVNPHLLHKCDYMACICVAVCLLVWVSEFVYNWVSVVVVGQHIKSSVSCWSSFTWGSARSLNFPAFQLVYSGTCQASPPFEKPSACR